MERLNITYAKYFTDYEGNQSGVVIEINNKRLSVPLDPANRHYAEIMRQVEAGELIIQEADSGSE